MVKERSSNVKISDRGLAWIEAAKALGVDVNAKVLCPECGSAHLEVFDMDRGKEDDRLDRALQCPNCHAANVLYGVMKDADK